MIAATIPNCRAYDPAFAYEAAVILDRGVRSMMEESRDEFYYITAMNESYDQPSIPLRAEAGIIKGLYLFTSHVSKEGDPLVRLLGSGAIFPEVAEAAKMLEAEWDESSEVWIATSYSELARDARQAERRNRLNPLDEQARREGWPSELELVGDHLVLPRLLQTCIQGSHPGEEDVMPRRAEDDSDPTEPIVRLSVPAQLKRTGKEMKFIVEGDREERTADPSLVRLFVRAHMLARRLAENPGSTLEDVAAQENMGGPYAARVSRLNYLAPDIVAAILDGKHPVDLTANKLMADTRFPLDWRAQRAALGFA